MSLRDTATTMLENHWLDNTCVVSVLRVQAAGREGGAPSFLTSLLSAETKKIFGTGISQSATLG